jgi:hypothetical protein
VCKCQSPRAWVLWDERRYTVINHIVEKGAALAALELMN